MNAMTQRRTLEPSAEPYATMPAPATARIERLLPGPVERVWSYLTDSDKRAKWFAGGEMEMRQGGAVMLVFRNSDLSAGQPRTGQSTCSADGVDHVIDGVVTRCEPPHLLAFTFGREATASEATCELTEEGPDTRLVITHRRLANRGQLLGVAAGWHTHVGILIDLLGGETPRLFWPEHARLERVYAERFAE